MEQRNGQIFKLKCTDRNDQVKRMEEGSACSLAGRRQLQKAESQGPAPSQEASYCMRPEQQVTRSHLPQGNQGPLWAGGNKVGNYTNSEETVPEDTFFNTPFEGTQIRADGTAGIVTDDQDFTGAVRPFERRLPVEAGRYCLIWTPFCPYATRTKITLNLLGIGEDVIRTIRTDPVKTEEGWILSEAPARTQAGREGSTAEGTYIGPVSAVRDDKENERQLEPVSRGTPLKEIYESTAPGKSWNATIPVLVGRSDMTGRSGMAQTGGADAALRVVNNDYHRLPLYFETAWKPFHKQDAPDLYPVKLRSQIDRLERVLFNDVESRAYAAGYADNQADYEHSFYIFFNRLGWLDRYLGRHRFLMGDQITDPDIRLYAALARLDDAYYSAFRLNGMRLRDYENLWRYAKELYAMPAFREATDFDAIRRGYYLGQGAVNPFRIVPDGPDESVWDG